MSLILFAIAVITIPIILFVTVRLLYYWDFVYWHNEIKKRQTAKEVDTFSEIMNKGIIIDPSDFSWLKDIKNNKEKK